MPTTTKRTAKKLTPKKRVPKDVEVWIQEWEESEAGWGTRPDGFTIHLQKEHINAKLKAMRDQEAARGYSSSNVPAEYSRPSGDALRRFTNDPKLIKELKASKDGIWGQGNHPDPKLFRDYKIERVRA